MIIFRYLAKDVFITLVALTSVLLLIFMSNQCIQYLNRAVGGQIPGVFIIKLMMLELPNLAGLLLPLGFYLAIMLSYGRLYADNEMIALFAGGYSPQRLLLHSLLMASVVAGFVSILIFYAAPWIAFERAQLLKTTGVQVMIQTLSPGRFKALQGGDLVFYVEKMSRNHEKAKNVFLARRLPDEKWEVVWAQEAFGQVNKENHEDELLLSKGATYIGVPGQAKYQVIDFDKVNIRLPHPQNRAAEDIRTVSTKTLWPFFNENKKKAAELQWRFSIPLMVMILTLVAVPLSRVNPRSGKYANLLPAILVYGLYANMMFFARNWIENGRIPVWIGLSWLHLLVASLGIYLLWKNRRKLA